ncbi:MAG: hypothetical protein M1587_00840, partial [Thaumarchaeota archaeon]|nr:hypothetical protein [Nitrososphaerota archaeon]
VVVLFRKMLDQLIKSGDLLLFQPFQGIDSEQVGNLLGSFQQNPRKRRVEILWPNQTENGLSPIPEDGRLEGHLEGITLDLRKRYPERTLVALLDLASILGQHGWTQDDWINRLMRFMHRDIDLTLLVARKGSINEKVHFAAEIRLEILDMRGTLFLVCKVPYSQFYGVSTEKRIGRTLIELEPMV